MVFREGQMTARDAAKRFAEEHFDEPRKVGAVVAARDAALKFMLVGGTRWYAVRMLPDFSGWEVSVDNGL